MMKPVFTANTRSLILIFVLVLPGCAQKKLDHFRFYEVAPSESYPAIQATMELRGQLDKGRDPLRLKISNLHYFGPPTIKNRENNNELLDPDDHLAWYDFIEPGAEVDVWKVTITNQFTNDKEIVFGLDNMPFAVLVPTWKKKGPLKDPQNLSHYKLYRITGGESVDEKVNLDDQFLKNGETVLTPVYFGVPVAKRVGNKRVPIKSEEHLTIYKLSETPVPKPREVFKIKNQFEDDRAYEAIKSFYLAVPTNKVHADKIGQPPND